MVCGVPVIAPKSTESDNVSDDDMVDMNDLRIRKKKRPTNTTSDESADIISPHEIDEYRKWVCVDAQYIVIHYRISNSETQVIFKNTLSSLATIHPSLMDVNLLMTGPYTPILGYSHLIFLKIPIFSSHLQPCFRSTSFSFVSWLPFSLDSYPFVYILL